MQELATVAGRAVDLEQEADDALALAARHDPQAFEALYVRFRAPVYRYLRSRVETDEDAADLAAATFERALSAIDRYRPAGGGPLAWLLRIARNAAIDAGRRRASNDRTIARASAAAAVAHVEPNPQVAAEHAESVAELRRWIRQLPEPQREALGLRYASGLTAREIGIVLGKSEAATQKLLTRALAALKEAYRASA